VAELVDVTVGYDGVAVLSDVDFAVERGEKVALVGPNGAGKTTLLRLLLGELAPMKGRCTIGANVDVAYFAQHQVEALDLERTALQEIQAAAGTALRDRNLRSVLGSFGFSGEAADRKVGALSGGRADPPGPGQDDDQPGHLLVLDEPTQPPRPGQLRRARGRLDAYPGTIVLVTTTATSSARSPPHSSPYAMAGQAGIPGVDEAILSPHRNATGTGAASRPRRSAAATNGRAARPVQKRSAAEVAPARAAATKS
jgi:ATP-binding cassette subfamily F protein 3